MTWRDEPMSGTDAFKARALYVRLFNPGADVPGEDWTDFITTVCGKPERDFEINDWRKVQDVMRHYLPPPGATVDPCPYLQWYADTHPGCRAE